MSKAEAREKRLQLKLEKFAGARAATLEKVLTAEVPKSVVEPVAAPEPKLAPHLLRRQNADQEPKAVFNGGRFDATVTWCIKRCDTKDSWSWKQPRAWTEDEWAKIIEPTFKEFEKNTWQEIDDAGSGSGHKMHHSQELWELQKEAQSRWVELELQEFDPLFRFRLGNMKRAWGYIVQAHFHMVWWERDHDIYKSKSEKK